EGAHGQCLEGYRRSFRAVRAHQDDRQAMAAHDFFEHVQAPHAGHFQIERYNLGLELFNLLETEVSVHGCTYHLDRTIGLYDLRDQLPHKGGVVDNQDSYGSTHCCASTEAREIRARSECESSSPQDTAPASWGRNLEKRSTMAARFRIKTTR